MNNNHAEHDDHESHDPQTLYDMLAEAFQKLAAAGVIGLLLALSGILNLAHYQRAAGLWAVIPMVLLVLLGVIVSVVWIFNGHVTSRRKLWFAVGCIPAMYVIMYVLTHPSLISGWQ